MDSQKYTKKQREGKMGIGDWLLVIDDWSLVIGDWSLVVLRLYRQSMPIRLPEKVRTSPQATRTVSWISPCGSIYNPQKRSTIPMIAKMAAVKSCMFAFIFISVFKIRCKSSTKKRSHQESDFAKYKNLIFFSIVGQIVPAILRKMFGF